MYTSLKKGDMNIFYETTFKIKNFYDYIMNEIDEKWNNMTIKQHYHHIKLSQQCSPIWTTKMIKLKSSIEHYIELVESIDSEYQLFLYRKILNGNQCVTEEEKMKIKNKIGNEEIMKYFNEIVEFYESF